MKVRKRTGVIMVEGEGRRVGMAKLGAAGTRTMDRDRNLEGSLKEGKK